MQGSRKVTLRHPRQTAAVLENEPPEAAYHTLRRFKPAVAALEYQKAKHDRFWFRRVESEAESPPKDNPRKRYYYLDDLDYQDQRHWLK